MSILLGNPIWLVLYIFCIIVPLVRIVVIVRNITLIQILCICVVLVRSRALITLIGSLRQLHSREFIGELRHNFLHDLEFIHHVWLWFAAGAAFYCSKNVVFGGS